MLISDIQTKVGDELVVPVNGHELIYAKVLRKNAHSFTCSIFKYKNNEKGFESDISKHNSKYYLEAHRDRYLVKREDF